MATPRSQFSAQVSALLIQSPPLFLLLAPLILLNHLLVEDGVALEELLARLLLDVEDAGEVKMERVLEELINIHSIMTFAKHCSLSSILVTFVKALEGGGWASTVRVARWL